MAMREVITEYGRKAHNQIKTGLPQRTHTAAKRLIEAGYDVQVKSPYHLHVRKPGRTILVNVWPTASKVMVQYDIGATVYENLLKAVAKLFDAPVVHEKTAEQIDAYEKHQSMLEKLRNEINGSS